MAFTLTNDLNLNDEPKHRFYTDDEVALLSQLEQGLVETLSHDQVMENLRKKLELNAE